MTAGQTYTMTKFVDVSSTAPTLTGAQAAAAAAAAMPWQQLLPQNARAWASLWRGRIDVAGDPTLATDVNASEFYLWSSTRADQEWSISPAGLSSNGYDGHIFWDAETWMFPSLLAQHPDLADAMEDYRFHRLPRPSSTPPRPATRARGSRGRARWTAPSRSRRRSRSTARGSTSSTSPPTSPSRSGSTTAPATGPG